MMLLRATSAILVLLFAVLNIQGIDAQNCLDDGRLSLIFDGSPTALSTSILRALKNEKVTATFLISTDKLDSPSASSFVKSAMEAGHAIGLSISSTLKINTMSQEGLMGVVGRNLDSLESLLEKKPLLVKLPIESSPEAIQQIEASGLIVIRPALDLSGKWAGECPPAFQAYLQSASVSPVIVIGDTDIGCNISDIIQMLKGINSLGRKAVDLNACLGTESLYRQERDIGDISINWPSHHTATQATGTASALSGNSASTITVSIVKPGLVLLLAIIALIL